MGLRRGAAGLAGGHDDRSAVAQAGRQERSVSPYPISMISARSSRAGKLRRRVFAGRAPSCARLRDISAGESHGAAAECDLISRYLFSLGVSAAPASLYRDARAVTRAAIEAKPAEIGSIPAIHRVPAQNRAVAGGCFKNQQVALPATSYTSSGCRTMRRLLSFSQQYRACAGAIALAFCAVHLAPSDQDLGNKQLSIRSHVAEDTTARSALVSRR